MADLSVANWLVSEGELTEVEAAHVSLDFDWGPVFASVDFGNGRDHLGGDDAITEVSLHGLGLFTGLGGLDGALQFLDETSVSGVDSASISSALLGGEKSNHALLVELEEFIELDSTVNLLLERLSLDGCCWCDRRHLD